MVKPGKTKVLAEIQSWLQITYFH